MNIFLAAILGIIFIYFVIKSFLLVYSQNIKDINSEVKDAGYSSYGKFKKIETKKETLRNNKILYERKREKYDYE